MKVTALLSVLLLCGIGIAPGIDNPTTDLASPNPATRAKAAAILRRTYIATPRAHFEKLLLQIGAGQSKRDLAITLALYHVRLEESMVMGMTWNDFYQLDTAWVLHVWGLDRVAGAELIRRTEKFWVQPPSNFVGTWTAYYANGQKMYEKRQNDADGVNEIWFYDNGRPWCVSTNTENTYYFRDGRVQPKDHVSGPN